MSILMAAAMALTSPIAQADVTVRRIAALPPAMDYRQYAEIDLPLSRAEGEQCLNTVLAEAGPLSASQVSQAKIPTSFGIKLRKQKPPLPVFGNSAISYHLVELSPNHSAAALFLGQTTTRRNALVQVLKLARCANDTRHPEVVTNSYVLDEGASAKPIGLTPAQAALCIDGKLYNETVTIGRQFIRLNVSIDNIGAGNSSFGYVILTDGGQTRITADGRMAFQDKMHGKSSNYVDRLIGNIGCLST